MINKHIKLVIRCYTQKPRTTIGWLGTLNQPDIYASADINHGMKYARKMMIEIAEMNLAIADEAVFVSYSYPSSDLVSWLAIGARSSEDQEHRVYASSLDCAVGMKNPTHGSLKTAVNSVYSAQSSYTTIINNHMVETSGNEFAHLVLRGAQNKPNYTMNSLMEVHNYFSDYKIKNPALLIDVSHDKCMVNGVKDFKTQPQIIMNILNELNNSPLKNLVKGFMIESFLKEGSQLINSSIDMNGLSITDPCIGIDRTKKILLDIYNFREEND